MCSSDLTNAESGASGTATITFITTKDSAGNITAATCEFAVSMKGFPSGTLVTAAHVHEGAVGVNGGVKINTAISAGDSVVSNGSGAINSAGINVTPDLVNAILANPAGYYFNVHTQANAGGVMRGQLVRNN